MEAVEVSITEKTRRWYFNKLKTETVNMIWAESYAIAEAARWLDIDRSLLGR